MFGCFSFCIRIWIIMRRQCRLRLKRAMWLYQLTIWLLVYAIFSKRVFPLQPRLTSRRPATSNCLGKLLFYAGLSLGFLKFIQIWINKFIE